MIQLRELCDGLGRLEKSEDGDVWVARIDHDSRAVQTNSLFMALPGRKTNGLRFVRQAIENGAVAVGLEDGSERPFIAPPVVWFPKARSAMAQLAKRVADAPNEALEIVAVTGTNGKTSVTTIVHHVLLRGGLTAGLIGTIQTKIGTTAIPTNFTTPESTDLFRLLKRMREESVKFVCVEFSSIGIEEHRVDGTNPGIAAYLNLTQDHLDYHKTMDAYGSSKAKLFIDHLASGGRALISIDDDFGRRLSSKLLEERPDVETLRVSNLDERADVFGALECHAEGIRGVIRMPNGSVEISAPLLGDFNRQNLTFAVALAASLGVDPQTIVRGLGDVCIPGRLELIPRTDGRRAVVDYAHTPDALSAAIRALRPLTAGRLICVFGCGGDRDRTKRPQMARAASAADLVIVTNDNPRSERPEEIVSDILNGFDEETDFQIELDRRTAIHEALNLVGSNDLVLVAGKGHESYQEVNGERLPFSDRTVIANWSAEEGV